MAAAMRRLDDNMWRLGLMWGEEFRMWAWPALRAINAGAPADRNSRAGSAAGHEVLAIS
jgi:hypothetical protein